jgi:hypothetical protein
MRVTLRPETLTRAFNVTCTCCFILFLPCAAWAANATVNFGFTGSGGAASVVAPTEPVSVGTTNAPVYKNIQNTTELDTSQTQQESGGATPTESPTAAQQAPARGIPRNGIGIDASFTPDLKIYNIPLSHTFNRNFGIQINIPIVSASFDDVSGGAGRHTGLGDVSLTFKHRIGSENRLAALYSLFTAKFASGNADQGLGTGSYDLSLTEKVIKRLGDFRCTLMGGVTQPVNKPTILGSEVEYGTNIAYMAAVEHSVFMPELWFGVRGAGMHSFQTKIDGIGLGNALTTVDVIPEFNFYFKRYTSVNLGATIPVYTDYGLPGGSTTRDIAINIGISTLF